MRRRWLGTLLMAWGIQIQAAGVNAPLQYDPPSLPAIATPLLNDSQWRWLGSKRELVLGFYGPTRPPFIRVDSGNVVSGYLPDFTWAVARSLGLTLRMVTYLTPDEAAQALARGDVDMLFNPAGRSIASQGKAGETVKIADALPVEVTRENRSASSNQQAAPAPSDEESTPRQQLALLAQGRLNRAELPAAEAYYLTSRNYIDSLQISAISPGEMSPYRFITRPDDSMLADTLREAVNNLHHQQAAEVLNSRWEQNDFVRFVSSSLNLTPEEKSWLASHPVVSVAVSSFNAPFFLTDSAGQQTGIAPELFNLIGLKAGIRFSYKDMSDSREILPQMQKGEVLMTAPLVWSQQRSRDYLMTAPFMFTPQVLVTAAGKGDNEDIRRAATINDQDTSAWFNKVYPQAVISPLGNPSLAMQWVAEEKTDATINTLINARYIAESLYPGKLHLQQILSLPEAAITFGVRRSDPELRSIINKSLALLPPGMITRILTRWQITPVAHFDTWKIYRTEFYTGGAAALTLILITAVWAVLLRRQVRRTQRTKAQLRQEIIFRDALINGPPRPVYVASADGIVIHTNAAFTGYFAPSAGARLALNLFDTRHPLYQIWQEGIHHLSEDNAPFEADYTVDDGHGNLRHIRHWMTRDVGSYIGGWQDVTEYLNLQHALSSARAEAELASESKSRFLTTMSHEIRTPLSAIVGLLELQVREGRTDTELIRVAHESSLSLLALIGDILDISRIESGHMTLNSQWTRLSSLIRPVAQAFSGLARQKDLALNVILPDNDCDVLTDGHRLRQVLANLVGNAVKFTQEGEICLRVILVARQDNTELHIEVEDTGPGIPAAAQKNLFMPFEQAGKTDPAGSGLGLSICREITALMGGTITLESEAGCGTLLRVKLPVECREFVAAVSPSTPEPALSLPLRVLIVDDHPANRLLVSRQLSLLGHTFTEAGDGALGLETWRTERPDVIITDCSMPVMDGPEMARRIRQADPKTVIIGITANAQETARARCLEAGMNECLFRPVELLRLATVLSELVRPEDHSAAAGELADWVDMANLAKFLPDDEDAVGDFIATAIRETRTDLQQARHFISNEDYAGAGRVFHRMAGTLLVIGVSGLTECCELLEELAEMEEEPAVMFTHLVKAEAMLEAFTTVFHKAHPDRIN